MTTRTNPTTPTIQQTSPIRPARRFAGAILSAAALAAAAGCASAAPVPHPAARADAPSIAITIYSSAEPGGIPAEMYRPTNRNPYQYQQQQLIPGYAVVREDRSVTLDGARATVKITDVAALIDPTTVSFKSLTDPDGTRVLDQNFQFDLVSNEKLLQRFLDKEIKVQVLRGQEPATVSGTLLSGTPGGMVLRQEGGTLQVVAGYQGLELPSLPDGLITRPTLLWDLTTKKPGEHTARISYQTEGITWWSDYNLVFTDGENANKGTLDVSAWVSILNQSGAAYKDATLKLVAGTVHRAQPPGRQDQFMGRAAAMEKSADESGFAEKSFFEYHLYTLGRPATIPENSTKQVELFPTARNVPAEKILVYDGLGEWHWWGGDPYMDQNFGVQTRKDVDVYLKFDNKKDKGLGIPLPAGRIRVSKLDPADGALEFIGEDIIRHTPRDEEVLVKLGKAFDVVGERKQMDFKLDTGRKTMEEAIEIEVRNRKDEPVNVVVQERMLRWITWEFMGAAPEHKKLDARTVHFPVSLAKGESKKVTFRVKYTW